MRQLTKLLACLALILSLVAGSVAHATEPVGCIDVGATDTAIAIVHADGDGDQVPADAGKGYPHHHGSCHGDHVAAPLRDDRIATLLPDRDSPAPAATKDKAAKAGDPALRPPQA